MLEFSLSEEKFENGPINLSILDFYLSFYYILYINHFNINYYKKIQIISEKSINHLMTLVKFTFSLEQGKNDISFRFAFK